MPTRLRLSCRALLIIVQLLFSWAPGLPPAKSGPVSMRLHSGGCGGSLIVVFVLSVGSTCCRVVVAIESRTILQTSGDVTCPVVTKARLGDLMALFRLRTVARSIGLMTGFARADRRPRPAGDRVRSLAPTSSACRVRSLVRKRE